MLPDFLAAGKEGGFNPLERLREGVVEYVTQYGTKLCCFDDLVPYLGLLVRRHEEGKEEEGEVGVLVEAIKRHALTTGLIDSTEEELKSNFPKEEVAKRLRVFTLSQQLLRYLGVEQPLDTLCQVYFRTLFVNEGAEGGQREVQLGDDLVLLAGHVLHDLINKAEEAGDATTALGRRLELACLIGQSHTYSPYNYHFKILLKKVRRRRRKRREEGERPLLFCP